MEFWWEWGPLRSWAIGLHSTAVQQRAHCDAVGADQSERSICWLSGTSEPPNIRVLPTSCVSNGSNRSAVRKRRSNAGVCDLRPKPHPSPPNRPVHWSGHPDYKIPISYSLTLSCMGSMACLYATESVTINVRSRRLIDLLWLAMHSFYFGTSSLFHFISVLVSPVSWHASASGLARTWLDSRAWTGGSFFMSAGWMQASI